MGHLAFVHLAHGRVDVQFWGRTVLRFARVVGCTQRDPTDVRKAWHDEVLLFFGICRPNVVGSGRTQKKWGGSVRNHSLADRPYGMCGRERERKEIRVCERARESETSSTILSVACCSISSYSSRGGPSSTWAGEPWGVGAGDG